MPTVAVVDGILVVLYWNDHDPPHFHADGPDFRARIRIQDGAVLGASGTMPATARRTKRNWTQLDAWPSRSIDGQLASSPRAEAAAEDRLMAPRIARAVPSRDLTVAIEWTDGSRSVANLQPYAAKGGVLAPLADPSFFVGTMKVHWRGDCLSWEGDIDFSAEGLWADSRRQTAAAE